MYKIKYETILTAIEATMTRYLERPNCSLLERSWKIAPTNRMDIAYSPAILNAVNPWPSIKHTGNAFNHIIAPSKLIVVVV